LIVAVSEPFDTIPLAHRREQRTTFFGAYLRRRLREADSPAWRSRGVVGSVGSKKAWFVVERPITGRR